jgi:hypothetical protein
MVKLSFWTAFQNAFFLLFWEGWGGGFLFMEYPTHLLRHLECKKNKECKTDGGGRLKEELHTIYA